VRCYNSGNNTRALTILPSNDAPTVPKTAKAISVNEDFNISSTFDGATDSAGGLLSTITRPSLNNLLLLFVLCVSAWALTLKVSYDLISVECFFAMTIMLGFD